jgi:hypothetical protein
MSKTDQPFTTHCTFAAGGDLTLALETNHHLPGKVVAVLRNDHKGWRHAVRVLECDPRAALPEGHCGTLSRLAERTLDRQLLDGLNRLLRDCATLLPSDFVPAGSKVLDQPDHSSFTVRLRPRFGTGPTRSVGVYDADDCEVALTFVNLPEGWTDRGLYESPLCSAEPVIQEAAERALLTSRARSHRIQANADTYKHVFGCLDARFSDSPAGPLAHWTSNSNDGGIELSLFTADPKDSWQLLLLLEKWLGHHQMPDLEVALDETRRSVSARLRGTAPVHFLAWYRAQQ